MQGAKVGYFNTKDLEACLEKEPVTDKILLLADKTLKEAFEKHDASLGVKALTEAAEGMAEMIKEVVKKDKEGRGKAICGKLFFQDKYDYERAATFERELMNGKTTMKMEGDKLMFNNKDISGLGKPLGEAVKKGQYRHMGFLLASTLLKADGAKTWNDVPTPPEDIVNNNFLQ